MLANAFSSIKNKVKEFSSWKNACLLLIISYSVLILSRAFLGDLIYDELDSNTLPAISIQYRASIIINQSDILQAQKDFPEIYEGVNGYDDLRSSGLIKITENDWMAYYFPIYPFTCIPVKLIFALIGVSQTRAFTVTNALLVILALTVIYKLLNTTYVNKFIALIFIVCSPIWFYINYFNYECFMFSMLTISMVMYVNDRRKFSAFFLSLAGMSNSAVMAVGLVMILAYGINILYRDWKNGIKKMVSDNWKETLLYALCFVPCLIPFITQKIYLSSSVFSISSNSFLDYSDRVIAYWFDMNLGVFSFAPIQIAMLAVIVIMAMIQKNWRVLLESSFSLVAVMGVSLMYHINCGMLYCSRYVVWIYPLIALNIAVNASKVINRKAVLSASSTAAVCTGAAIMIFNGLPSAHDFNNFTEIILDNIPQIYNPYYATFICRADHRDGGYNYEKPIYYCDSEDNNIRKILYRASDEDIMKVKDDLKGSDESINYYYNILDKEKLDGQLHYINISKSAVYQIGLKTELEKLIEKYENTDSEEIINESNIYMEGSDSLYQFSYQTEFQSNTMYRITLKLPENFDFDNSEIFFVDFYGGPEYDSPEQEVNNFLKKAQYEYTFFINSGYVPVESTYIRIIDFVNQQNADTNIVIEQFKVEKLESIPETVILSEKPMLNFNGSYYEIGYPIELMDNTNYIINIEMSENFIPNNAQAFFVDFYGGSGYDAAEQEISLLNEEQKKDYTFTINSGDVPDVQTYVRIVYSDNSSEEQASIVKCIESFEVSEAA